MITQMNKYLYIIAEEFHFYIISSLTAKNRFKFKKKKVTQMLSPHVKTKSDH